MTTQITQACLLYLRQNAHKDDVATLDGVKAIVTVQWACVALMEMKNE